MKVSPSLRRALHQAVDLIVDALNEDAPKAKRGRVHVPPPEMPKDVRPEEIEAAERRWSRVGMKRKGC